VELEFYGYEECDILIPHLFGAESVKKDVSGGNERWDEKEFFEYANNKVDEVGYKAMCKLYKFSKEYADDIQLLKETIGVGG